MSARLGRKQKEPTAGGGAAASGAAAGGGGDGGEAVIGVDVGGTKVSVAAMSGGRLGEPRLEPTDKSSGEALIEQLVRAVEGLRAALAAEGEGEGEGEEVSAVGVGIPSVIQFETGRVRSSVNVPLADVPLREVLRERLGIPAYVDNDATCAALAEAYDEGGRLLTRHLVMLTVGTGVGGGIVVDGHIYRGATGAAAEIGHILVGADLHAGAPPSHESFPQPGSLEALASGRALDELARRAAADHPDSELAHALARGEAVAGPHAVEAAKAGDEAAVEVVRLLGERLGVGVANVINIFDPEVVAVGGGVCTAGELLLAPARRTAARFILPGVGTRTEIRQARSGPLAGVRGAALLARQELRRERGRADQLEAGGLAQDSQAGVLLD